MTVKTHKPVLGTTGYMSSHREMIVSGNPKALTELKALLTIIDLSVESSIFQLKKKIPIGQARIKKMLDAGYTSGHPIIQQLQKTQNAIEWGLKKAQEDLIVEYWAQNDSASLSMSPGFWHLVENVEGNLGDVPYVDLPADSGFKPRYYQEEAVKEVLKYKRASIVAATGLGKCGISSHLAYCYVQAGLRVLIIVPNINLMQQNLKQLKQFVPSACAIGDGHRLKPGAMAAVSTIHSSKGDADIWDCVIVDENQFSGADSYTDLLTYCNKATYWTGMTATNYRSDGLDRGLENLCGPVVYEKDTKWGIKEGFLSDARPVMVNIKGLPWIGPDVPYALAYSKLANHPKTRAAIDKLLKSLIARDKTTLILFKTVEPGREYTETTTNGKLGFAYSKFKGEFAQFCKGDIKTLVSNSSLLGVGTDVPGIDAMIVLTNGSSEGMVRQILGRGLRKAAGKEYCVFFDLVFDSYGPMKNAAIARKRIYDSVFDEVKTINM
jgi:superfamily II DNA or RNA helicase